MEQKILFVVLCIFFSCFSSSFAQTNSNFLEIRVFYPQSNVNIEKKNYSIPYIIVIFLFI